MRLEARVGLAERCSQPKVARQHYEQAEALYLGCDRELRGIADKGRARITALRGTAAEAGAPHRVAPFYFARSTSIPRNLIAVSRSDFALVTIVTSTNRPVLDEAIQLPSSYPLQP